MTVTLLYFDGCPHWSTADERLQTAFHRAGRDVEVERRKVENVEEAEDLRFAGVPHHPG